MASSKKKAVPAPAPSPLPVYTYSGEGEPDPAEWPTTGEVTTDGAALYNFTGDSAGQPAAGDGLGGVWTLYTGEQDVLVDDADTPDVESSEQIAAAAPLDPPVEVPAADAPVETPAADVQPPAEEPTAEQEQVETITDAAGTPIAQVITVATPAVAVTPEPAEPTETAEPAEPTGTSSVDPEGNVDGVTPAPDPATVTLDAPAPPAPPQEPELPQATVASTGVARILSRVEGDIDLYDNATGEPPDPDGLFDRPWEYANLMVCTKRLIERVYVGPFAMPTDRLLLPAGAQVPIPHAEAIVARLKAQQAEQAAAAAAEAAEAAASVEA